MIHDAVNAVYYERFPEIYYRAELQIRETKVSEHLCLEYRFHSTNAFESTMTFRSMRRSKLSGAQDDVL